MRADGLIGLHNNPAVNRTVEFAAVANTLASDVGMLARCYEHLVRVAPRRHARSKRYVHGRTGTTSSGASSNRREEHLAVALCNASRSGVTFALPDRRPLAIIDYQMPLKARQGDLGVGKVDLFAVVDGRLPCVIELKAARETTRGDTPLRALLEGLAYCAIVEANAADIASEVAEQHALSASRPALGRHGAGQLLGRVPGPPGGGKVAPRRSRSRLGPSGNLGAGSLPAGAARRQVRDGPQRAAGSAHRTLPDGIGGRVADQRGAGVGMGAYDDYVSAVVDHFWDYAEHEFGDRPQLFERSDRSPNRPPVFVGGAAEHNVLYPPHAEPNVRQTIVTSVPTSERHRHFASMRSSQALAQSVFGSLAALGKAGVLAGLTTDDELPTVRSGVTVQMEHLVEHLGEPRSTSVDVWLDGGEQRVAVECKFTEREFGRCSRPTLRPGKDANYARDHCDGSYTRQRGRRTHCSLTEIGVRYWEYLPELFDWSADRNMDPCPLQGTYQLARNVLAACVQPDGTVDANSGHALVIYDDRNPAFLPGGEAAQQWEAATWALVRRSRLPPVLVAETRRPARH